MLRSKKSEREMSEIEKKIERRQRKNKKLKVDGTGVLAICVELTAWSTLQNALAAVSRVHD